MSLTAADLLSKSQKELDDLFTQAETGPVPVGKTKGTAIVMPGTSVSGVIAKTVELLFWQGKIFNAERGVLRNLILPFGLKAIVASVYKGDSWLDGKECIVIDYSETSLVACRVRDEIRQIAPGLYLGKVYWARKRAIDFALRI